MSQQRSRSVKTCSKCGKETMYISWSKLRTYETCAQAAYLASVKRVKAAPQDQRNFFAGTVTDRVVRDWLLSDPHNNPNIMPDMVDDYIAKEEKKIEESKNFLVWRNSDDKNNIRNDCVQAVTNIEPHLNKLVLPYEYQPDYGFKAPISIPHPRGGKDTVVLNGFMDIIVHDKDRDIWAIYDVKHTKDNAYWRKTLGQLSFYDLALFVTQGKQARTTGLLQPLCKEQVFSMNPTRETLIDLTSRVNSMAYKLWSNEAPVAKDSSVCGFCNVKHACSKFKPVSVGGKNIVSFG